jgi:TRAP-type mannitol/chloroaromatic compound transport system permease large subunit
MGTVLAAMTGIIGASVTMMTALALPTMIRQGYSHALSCGTIAASGTLGILIPPSIMLIIMADLLAISVGDVFMAAIVPGLGLSVLYLAFVVIIAGLKPSIAPPLDANALSVPKEELWSGFTPWSIAALLVTIVVYYGGSAGYIAKGFSGVLLFLMVIVTIACFVGPLLRRAFLPPVALITLIKGSILMGFATPSEAGAVGAFGAMLLALIAGRLNLSVLQSVCHASARTIAMIFFIIVSATCFAYVYRSLGGDEIVETLIHSAGLDSWGFLFLLMGIAFVLGFFLDWIEITLIVLPVFAPMVAGLDFGDHVAKADVLIWFTVLMAINLQTSFLTPPFGFALFYLKGIAPKEIKIQSVYVGIIPFVILQLVALILVINYPQLAMWLVHFE